MNRHRLTGFVVILGIFLMILIGLCALCSCTTKQKVITEYVTVHDTIHTHKTDTLREVSYQVRVDTIRQTETHTVTLNNVGDTIREVHYFHDREKVIVVDSTDRYKATVDSLKSALITEQNKYKEIVKTKHVVKWWEWLLILFIVGGLVYGAKIIKNG